MSSSVILLKAGDAAFRKAGVRETALLLLLAGSLPFVVQALPWPGEMPLGVHLLPVFWTAFVAVYFYGLGVGLLVGLFAPALNLFVTGAPVARAMALMGVELVVFVVCSWLALRRRPMFWLIAPMAVLLAKAASTLLMGALPRLGTVGRLDQFFFNSVGSGAVGVVVLGAINGALVKFWPKPDDWDAA